MRIQLYDRQSIEPASAGGVVRQGAGTADLGQAKMFGMLGQATEELAKRAQDAQRAADVSMRSLAFRRAYSEWYVQRSADPTGYRTLVSDSDNMLEKLGEQTMKGVEDPLAQAELTKHIAEFSGTQAIDARKTAISQQIDWHRGALEETIQSNRQEVANATNAADRRLLMDSTAQYIQASVAAGVISPVDGEKKLHQFVDGVAEDQLGLRIYRDPDGVLEELYTGQTSDGHASGLTGMSEEARQRVILNAEKRAEALRHQEAADRRRTEAAEDARKKAWQDDNGGRVYALAEQGRITRAELSDALNSGMIRGPHFRAAWDRLSVTEQKGGPGNPEQKTKLMLRVWSGDLRPGEVVDAMSGATGINREEAEDIIAENGKGAIVVQSQGYKAGYDALKKSLGIFAGIEGMSGAAVQRLGMAGREYYQAMIANPNANPFAVADEIGKRYADMNGGVVTPRFKTADEILNALRSNSISVQEANTYWHELQAVQQGSMP